MGGMRQSGIIGENWPLGVAEESCLGEVTMFRHSGEVQGGSWHGPLATACIERRNKRLRLDCRNP